MNQKCAIIVKEKRFDIMKKKEIKKQDTQKQSIQKIAAISLFSALFLFFFDTVYGTIQNGGTIVSKSAMGYIDLFNNSTFEGLYYLDIMSVIIYILLWIGFMGYIFTQESIKMKHILLGFALSFGVISFITNNKVFAIYDLYQQFLVADVVLRNNYIVAMESLVAVSEQLSLGTLIPALLTSIGLFLVVLDVYKEKALKKWIAYAGLIGFGLWVLYTPIFVLFPLSYGVLSNIFLLVRLCMMASLMGLGLKLYDQSKIS